MPNFMFTIKKANYLYNTLVCGSFRYVNISNLVHLFQDISQIQNFPCFLEKEGDIQSHLGICPSICQNNP